MSAEVNPIILRACSTKSSSASGAGGVSSSALISSILFFCSSVSLVGSISINATNSSWRDAVSVSASVSGFGGAPGFSTSGFGTLSLREGVTRDSGGDNSATAIVTSISSKVWAVSVLPESLRAWTILLLRSLATLSLASFSPRPLSSALSSGDLKRDLSADTPLPPVATDPPSTAP